MRQKLTKANSPEDRRACFLEALASHPWGSSYAVADAARAAGVHRATPYRWAKTDAAFAQAWEAITARRIAIAAAVYERERAARELRRRQRLAELRPQFQQLAVNARAAKRTIRRFSAG